MASKDEGRREIDGGLDQYAAGLEAIHEAETVAGPHLEGQRPRLRSARLGLIFMLMVFCLALLAGIFLFLNRGSDAVVMDQEELVSGDAFEQGEQRKMEEAERSNAVRSCVIPSDQLKLATTETMNETGKRDPSMFVLMWDTTLQNLGQDPILVVTQTTTRSSAGSSDEWTTAWVPIPPGGSFTWKYNSFDNNTSGRSGELEWNYVHALVAVRDTPDCADALGYNILQRDPVDVPPPASVGAAIN